MYCTVFLLLNMVTLSCLSNKNAKEKKLGQPGLTLENIDKTLIHFASPHPEKPLNCLKKLSASPKTIEVFRKPTPVPFPCYRGGDREGDPFNVPIRPL